MQFKPASSDGQFGEAIQFFRPQVACTIQKVMTRGNHHHSLNLELAPVSGDEALWSQKLTVQVSSTELPRFCACLLKLIRNIEYKYHGEHKNKSYALEWDQKGGLMVSLSTRGKRLFIQLTGDEVFWLAEMGLDQLHKNVRSMSKTDLMNLLSRSFRN